MVCKKTGLNWKARTERTVHSKELFDQEGAMLSIDTMVDKPFGRCMVKILLNFAAFYIGEEEVSRPEWKQAREFARYGRGTVQWTDSPGGTPLWYFKKTGKIAKDNYFLQVINYGKDEVIGIIQFFDQDCYHFKLALGRQLPKKQQVAVCFTRNQKPVVCHWSEENFDLSSQALSKDPKEWLEKRKGERHQRK